MNILIFLLMKKNKTWKSCGSHILDIPLYFLEILVKLYIFLF